VNAVSTAYEQTGRTGQKARTRRALVEAARSLIAAGEPAPTVEQTAEEAGISRTTAYRYFGSQHALLLAAHPEIEQTSWLTDGMPDEPEDRFLAVVDAFIAMTVQSAPQLRTTLRLALTDEPALPLTLRQGRAIGWFDDALDGLDPGLTAAERRRLVLSVRSAVGIESLVWLTEVAALTTDEAAEVMRWSARSLLAAAVRSAAGRGVGREP
jgi:AcrR family transcriptional regulator